MPNAANNCFLLCFWYVIIFYQFVILVVFNSYVFARLIVIFAWDYIIFIWNTVAQFKFLLFLTFLFNLIYLDKYLTLISLFPLKMYLLCLLSLKVRLKLSSLNHIFFLFSLLFLCTDCYIIVCQFFNNLLWLVYNLSKLWLNHNRFGHWTSKLTIWLFHGICPYLKLALFMCSRSINENLFELLFGTGIR